MELNDKQIKDLVARRHPEYEKKKEHWDFLASTYAGGRGEPPRESWRLNSLRKR
ncbi:hypothetical protein ACRWGR_23935 [Escherichia coli]